MKNFFVKIFLMTTMVIALASVSFSAFTSVKVSTFTAGVEFTGGATGALVADLYALDYTTPKSSITWSGVIPGITEWQVADIVVIVTCTYTGANSGIRIYTNNIADNAVPKWNGVAVSTATNNISGLLKYETGVATSTTKLPMCWRITNNTTNTFAIVEDVNYNLYESTLGSSYFVYQYMKDMHTPNLPDEGTTSFDSDPSGVAVWDKEEGYHHASGTNWLAGDNPYYIYIGADFSQASTPSEYRTNQLKLELYTE